MTKVLLVLILHYSNGVTIKDSIEYFPTKTRCDMIGAEISKPQPYKSSRHNLIIERGYLCLVDRRRI